MQQDLHANFLQAGENASRITSKPERAREELAHFDALIGKACEEMKALICSQQCNEIRVQSRETVTCAHSCLTCLFSALLRALHHVSNLHVYMLREH